jgi:hypothetical protein
MVWPWRGLPVSLFVHEGCFYNIAVVMMTSICIGLIVVVYEMSLRGHSERDGIGLMNFWVYVCFAIVFAGFAVHFYLRVLAREQAV